MPNWQVIRARKYLCAFEEILNQMAEKMLAQEVTNSITIDFISTMLPHHQAAIDMSKNLLEYSMCQPVQKIAQNIILIQTERMEQIKEIARTTYGFQNMPQEIECYQKESFKIGDDMIQKMKNIPKTIYINWNFVNEMILHQEGAIAMCENLLCYHIDPRLKGFANGMVEEQSQGVQELKEMRKKLSSKR